MRPIAAVGLSGFVALALACGGLPQGKAPRHDMPLRTYLAATPNHPVVMTLDCALETAPPGSDLYLIRAYDNASGLICNSSIQVRRDTPQGKAVFEKLKDGSEQRITLTVTRDRNGAVEIVEVHP